MKSKLMWMSVLMAVLWLTGSSRASLIAYDGFDTAATGDNANGIYQDGIRFTQIPNNTVRGGNIIGYTNTPSTYYWKASSGTSMSVATNSGKVGGGALAPRNTYSTAVTARRLTASMSGTTAAYASAWVRMDLNPGTNSHASYIGFSNTNASSGIGGSIGFVWDSTNSAWDLKVRYSNGAQTLVTVKEDMAADTDWQLVVWKMDEANDTLDIWVNPANISAAPTASLTDYVGTVNNISALFSYVKIAGDSGSGFYYDEIKLGDTLGDVIPEPATVSLFGITMVGLLLYRRAMNK